MKVSFVAEECYQVLLSGSWDSDDCNWDWDYKYHEFPTCKEAVQYINSLTITADMPIVILLKRVYTLMSDDVGTWWESDDTYVDERINDDLIEYRKEVE